MAGVGYSGTPLLKKLGIQPGMKVLTRHPPDNYFQLLAADISSQIARNDEIPDLAHLFVTSNKIFEAEMQLLQPLLAQNKKLIVWISWYKKSSGIPTDITEDVIRNYALRHGLVDIKVCAVSELWSGLKLVVPKANR